MQKKWIMPVISLVMLVGLVLALQSCHSGPFCVMSADSHAERVECAVDYLDDELELSQSQLIIAEQVAEDIITRFEEMHENRGEHKDFMIAQIRSDELNQELINAKFDEHAAKRKEVRIYVIDRLADLHKVLNDEQKEIIVEKIEEMHEHFEDRFHR